MAVHGRSADTELAHRFAYHPPRSRGRVNDHQAVRAKVGSLAAELDGLLPDDRPREKALVITNLEQAMFWANAALARAADPDAEVPADEAAAGPRD